MQREFGMPAKHGAPVLFVVLQGAWFGSSGGAAADYTDWGGDRRGSRRAVTSAVR